MLSSLTASLGRLRMRTAGDPRVLVAILDGVVRDPGQPVEVLNVLGLSLAIDGASSSHAAAIASVFRSPTELHRFRGLAPGCRLLNIPIYADSEAESEAESEDGATTPCSQTDLARALNAALDAGAFIVNLSGGQLASNEAPHPALLDALRRCESLGVLVVASAGNDGCACHHIPASEPSVLVAGAIDAAGRPLDFSNWGPGYASHGLVVPLPESSAAGISGTSLAAAAVSAIAALLLSEKLALDPQARPLLIRDLLLRTAQPCRAGPDPAGDCPRLLGGRLDLDEALRQLYSQEIPMIEQEELPVEMAVPPALPDPAPAIQPSACCQACEKGQASPAPPALVYALGTLHYDFGSEARRDSFQQSLANGGSPHLTKDLLAHLDRNPHESQSVIFTLNLDATPVYAVQPSGPFAAAAYERLRQFLREQVSEGVERVSIPGRAYGSVTLSNGYSVPLLAPELRGMYSWSTGVLIDSVLGKPPADKPGKEHHAARSAGLRGFLERVYHELRNLGAAPQDRARNYAATNAFQLATIFHSSAKEELELDSIQVERSPICRPHSDCWDVLLTFFHPRERLTRARRVHRFTVDVSDLVPVTVGPVRTWSVY